MKIAVLDDDQDMLTSISALMTEAGYRPTAFSRSAALLSALRRETFDLLIVDWQLPDRSGLDVIRWARLNLDPTPPMLLVTSRTDDADVVEGLAAGADDFLSKPVSAAVLTARIGALLRRAYASRSAGPLESHANMTFKAATSSVATPAGEVALTAKEFALAVLLFRNIHRALARTYLTDAVWGGDPGLSSRSLDMHISRIRSKLGLRPENGFRLMPVYSYGYRLEWFGAGASMDDATS